MAPQGAGRLYRIATGSPRAAGFSRRERGIRHGGTAGL